MRIRTNHARQDTLAYVAEDSARHVYDVVLDTVSGTLVCNCSDYASGASQTHAYACRHGRAVSRWIARQPRAA